MYPTSRVLIAILALTCVASSAQFYKPHNADVGLNLSGEFTSPLSENGPGQYRTTDSAGFLLNIRDHPVSWAGIELDGSFTTYGQQFTYTQTQALNTTTSSYNLRVSQYEATGGYLFHLHTPWVQPFVVIGGGGVDFVPSYSNGPNIWRGAGMYAIGFDFTSRRMPHAGFRIQQHALIYRAPTFNQPEFSTGTWVHQSDPAAGVYWKW